MKGVLGPGGAIYNVSPDGKKWELFSVGYRNEYDAAYNKAGDLFTYDADMEWDFNTPWYRPTRVCLATQRQRIRLAQRRGQVSGLLPRQPAAGREHRPRFADRRLLRVRREVPAEVPGRSLSSATGATANSMRSTSRPRGAPTRRSWRSSSTARRCPSRISSSIRIDGAMYFTIGGRKTKSGLYRVTYTGEGAGPRSHLVRGVGSRGAGSAATRLDLEKFHERIGQEAVDAAWKELDNADRFIQFAARVAIEHQDPKLWADKALAEKDPEKAILSILALVRVSAPCPEHTKDKKVHGDPALRAKMLARAWAASTSPSSPMQQKLDLVRIYDVLFNRFGHPTAEEREAWLAKYRPAFPNRQPLRRRRAAASVRLPPGRHSAAARR